MLKYISVLEQSVAIEGQSQANAIRDAVTLAAMSESWGYRRFWVSEHHSHPSIVGTAPEVLMAAIAASTKSIRIGSAGVMLPHYSTLKVAEQFRVLDALAPGRIDLGVGRAPGSDMRTAQLLNPDPRASDRFPEQIRDLDLWLRHEELPAGHPGRGVYAYPTSDTSPDLWILGSSDYGAQVAAHFGLPYAFAHFITDGRGCKDAIELYRQRFTPSIHLDKPHAVACVWALTAATEEEAWHQFSSRARWKMDRNKGLLGALPSPEHAHAKLQAHETTQLEQLQSQALVGSPDSVAKKLKDLANDLEIDEIVVITWAHDFEVRAQSYRLLAEALL
jgi:luciferase family oxidoreductase group 1